MYRNVIGAKANKWIIESELKIKIQKNNIKIYKGDDM